MRLFSESSCMPGPALEVSLGQLLSAQSSVRAAVRVCNTPIYTNFLRLSLLANVELSIVAAMRMCTKFSVS